MHLPLHCFDLAAPEGSAEVHAIVHRVKTVERFQLGTQRSEVFRQEGHAPAGVQRQEQ